MSVRFSIALLTEDKSEGTRRGLQAILEKLLRRFEDDGFTRRIEILPPDDEVRPILKANRWRCTKAKGQPDRYEAERRLLWRYIARKVSEPEGFVVFHYDGDERWSHRTDVHRMQFDRELRQRVEQVLSGARLSRQEVARRMARLIECVPYYSVEAWLYQATTRAIDLCREKHRGADVGKFKEWSANRTLLDDVWKPKDETCLGDSHNDDLGKHVAVWEVVRAGRSLFGFVWALHACPELEDALASPAA